MGVNRKGEEGREEGMGGEGREGDFEKFEILTARPKCFAVPICITVSNIVRSVKPFRRYDRFSILIIIIIIYIFV